MEDEAQYIRNKAFDNQYYRDLIVQHLKTYKKGKKKDFKNLLWDKLPDILTDKQEDQKITNLLESLKEKNIIVTDSANQQKSNWVLKETVEKSE